MESPRWLPLESNPDFTRQLGVLPTWQFGDVFGMDPELLSMVPRPVCSILLLFPVTEKILRVRGVSCFDGRMIWINKAELDQECALCQKLLPKLLIALESFHKLTQPILSISGNQLDGADLLIIQGRQEEESKIKSIGQEISPQVYFMKQTISNACGTVGLIHALANNQDKLEFESNSAIKKFLDRSSNMTPEEKAKYLEKDESIRVTHESSAQEGQTETPSLDEKVDLHFITFVNIDGHLYELDGRKPFPINHGHTNTDTFLEDAIEVCKKFMERDPGELRFTVVALSKA